jgi:thiamine biosynthesis protein ThiC
MGGKETERGKKGSLLCRGRMQMARDQSGFNTNLGTSSDHIDLEDELKKIKVSIQTGKDTVMALSTAGDIGGIQYW